MFNLQLLPLLAATLFLGNLIAQPTSPFKVMTYNIMDGYDHGKDKEREQKASDFIRSQKPDVVALQELVGFTEESLQEFAKSYGHDYSVLLKEKGYPVGLTSNKPIETKAKMLDSLWHGMLHAQTHGIDFFVVHLSPFDAEFRQREVRIITTYMKNNLSSDARYVVLGDFNSHSPFDAHLDDQRPILLERTRAGDAKKERYNNLLDGHFDYSVISRFLGYPLIDVTRRFVTGEERFSYPTPILIGTWRKPGEIVRTRTRIDYILTSRNLARQVTAAEIINGGIVDELSDHFPVVAEFKRMDD